MFWIVKNLWLIPALPLLAAGIIAVNKQPARKLAATLAIGSMAVGFLLSLCAFAATLGHHGDGVFREVFSFPRGYNLAVSGWTLAGCSIR